MLDNVLTSFIETAPDGMERAKYSALRERSVGLGVMGFHSFLQMKNIPLESAMAKSWNLRIFRKIRREADAASYILAEERGACPDAQEKGMKARFTHKLAIAPTASHLHHLRRHQRLRRADPGQCLHPQDPVGRLFGAQSLSAGIAGDQGPEHRRRPGSPSSSRKARCSIWTA